MIDEIGATSLMTAALRARETDRPDRICADPWARTFGAGLPAGSDDFVDRMADQVAVRTRFLDDALLGVADQGCDQVVLVACGMDVRAFRLDWPAEVTVFEVDQPAVLDAKDAALADARPRARRRRVPADLRTAWTDAALVAGLDPARPIAWLVEGLLYALDEPAADALLGTLTALSAPGSTLAFDHVVATPGFRAALRAMGPGLEALWRSGPRDLDGWLERHGWTATVTPLADVARRFGRRVHPDLGVAWLGTATR